MPSPRPIVSLATRLGTEELLARAACGPRPRRVATAPFIPSRSALRFELGRSRSFATGSCEANAATAGQAHELALKGAETDATKRALATFGNPFGLALYDREQNGVRKQRRRPEMHSGPWVLRSAAGSSVSSHDIPTAFIVALRRAMTEA